MREDRRKSRVRHRARTYLAKPNLDPSRWHGQRRLIAQVLRSYVEPRTLDQIVFEIKANGGYKIKAKGGFVDSVHWHLRALVKDQYVEEQNLKSRAASAGK